MEKQDRGQLVLATVAVAVIAMVLVTYAALSFQTALAQNGQQNHEENTLYVMGLGSVMVAPDRVSISLGVEVRAATAQEAVTENAELMDRVVAALRELDIQEKEVKTAYYNVYPEYDYREGKVPTLLGYRVSNTVTVTKSSTDNVGEIIDTAVSAGANRVNSVYFFVSDDRQRELRDEVIQKAVEDAKEKADIALLPMGLSVTGVKSITISEGGFPVPIIRAEVAAGAFEKTTPVFPGEQQVTASVSITYTIG